MKSKLSLFLGLAFPLVLFADNPQLQLLAPDKTPPQAYRSADDSSGASTSTPLKSSNSSSFAAVQRLQQQVTSMQQQQNSAQQAVNDKLAQVSKALMDFQQATGQQILMMTTKQQAALTQVQQMQDTVQSLDERLSHVEAVQQQTSFAHTTSQWLATLGPGGVLTIFAGLLIIIAIMLITLVKQARKFPHEAATEEEGGDYDLMNSQEGVGVKLDLATSYVAMEDYAAARKVLQEVLQKGNETQQKRAQELLNDIAKF